MFVGYVVVMDVVVRDVVGAVVAGDVVAVLFCVFGYKVYCPISKNPSVVYS